ncbi:hypothetical protein BS17DRAFT_790821 [Gyrodon lividus]|nr:hypothetical protein BS17DRAFT_790821 [Gyrodon lividus]
MPGKPKSGPPYNDPPPGTYVVVTNPWGMSTNSRARGQSDVNRVAAWLAVVLREAGVIYERVPTVECVYGMGTRDEIIIQFPVGTDVFPLLGEHLWARITKQWSGSPGDLRSSCVFLYNWQNNGDPANHNWTENYPNSMPPGSVPSRSPYPPPTWTRPPPRLTNFVHSLPRPPTPPPLPALQLESELGPEPTMLCSPEKVVPAFIPQSEGKNQPGVCDGGKRPVTQSPAPEEQPPPENTSLFSPYQPPPQHPSHAHFLDQNQQHPPTPSELTPEPKFIKKLDPYEIEEDALDLLRSLRPDPDPSQDSQDQDIKQDPEIEVKIEEIHTNSVPGTAPYFSFLHLHQTGSFDREHGAGYKPSLALLEAFNTLRHAPSHIHQPIQDPRKRPLEASSPPLAKPGYQPSAELEAAINSLFQSTGATSASTMTTVTNSEPRTTQPHPQGGLVSVKREYVDDEIESPCMILHVNFPGKLTMTWCMCRWEEDKIGTTLT